VAIEYRVNGAFRRNGDAGESANQTLADLTSAPGSVFALHVQDEVLHLKGKLVGVAIGAAATVRQPFNTAFLVAIENFVAGFAGDPKLPAQFGHRLAS
jgi:hypothetical protein